MTAAALPADVGTLRALVDAVLGLVVAASPDAVAGALARGGVAVAGADRAAVELADGSTFPAGAPEARPADVIELPIAVDGRPLARLRLERHDGAFGADERRLGFLLASHAAVMFERLAHESARGALLDQTRRAREEASRAREEASRLEELAAAVSACDELADTAAAAAETIAGATAASGVAFFLERESGRSLELVLAHGAVRWPARRARRLSAASATGVAEAFRTGRPVFTATPPWSDSSGGNGSRAPRGAAVPLLVAGRATGVLALTFRRSHEPDDGELALLVALAEIAAQALERAQRAQLQDRTARLHAVTVKLSQASTEAEVLSAIVENGIAALGAFAGTAAVVAEDGRQLEIAAAIGYPEETVEAIRSFPVAAPFPLAEAVRDGVPVLVESRSALVRRYPALADVVSGRAGGALVALPLDAGGRRLGGVGFTFERDRTFDADDVAFLQALAGLAAQALDRAQRTRIVDRTRRLQAVAAGLSSASSTADVAAVILDAGSDALGASAGLVVRVLDDARTLEVVGTRGYPSARVETWPRLVVPSDLARDPLVTAVSTGERVLVTSADELARRFPNAAAELAALETAAVAAIPLKLHGAVVGAVGFSFAESREFAPEDEAFLGALGELCAQALHRARLFAAAEASRNHLRELLERLREGLVAVARDLRIDFANAEATRLLGGAAAVGMPLPEHWEGFELAAFARSLLTSRASPAERRFGTDDGRTFEIAGIPGSDSAVLVLRDVSRQERRERAEREFVANAAHELRSPLTGILAALEALRLGAKDEAHERDRLLSGIEDEGRRLARLVQALLVLARAQSDPESLVAERVEIAPLVTETARTLEVRPGVRVEVDAGDAACAVSGDRALLDAALQNLARNASKHTERGAITFAWRRTAGGDVEIEVRDTGPGMSAAVVDRAFDRFYRGAGPDRTGSGLGLPLVREMTRILGGSVTIESAPRAGTTARLTLPAA